MQSIDPATLAELSLDDLPQPWDSEPDVFGDEVDKSARLDGDRSHFRTPTVRTFKDYRTNPEAFRHMARLPVPGESHHGVISGKYALWDLVPAVLERTGHNMTELTIATLGFSKQNGADMLAFLDARKIERLSLLVSHYYKSTSAEIYDSLVPHLLKRGQKVKAMRTHAKMLLMRMPDGTRYVVESSANLRSCGNDEQFVMSNDSDLYDFHKTWIDELIAK